MKKNVCGVKMPQAERTQNIIKLLKWLRDVQETATRGQIISYIKVEVTAMGATERTAVSYLEDCGHYGLIETVGSHQPLKNSELLIYALKELPWYLKNAKLKVWWIVFLT